MRSKLIVLSLSFLLLTTHAFADTLGTRQKAFLSALSKAKTPEDKIKRAEELAKDKKSKFRVDAVNYLIDEKSYASGPLMASLVRDPDVGEFAIFGVGELHVVEATPLLIRELNNENRNNRGNAYRALQKLYPQDFNFEYHYDDAPQTRKPVVDNIKTWWKNNRDRLKTAAMNQKTDKEKLEAEQRWERYGKEYLDRPSH